jgi:hypothetical protein
VTGLGPYVLTASSTRTACKIVFMLRRLRVVVLPALILCAVTIQVAARQRFSRLEADRFEGKLSRIVEFGNLPRNRTASRRATPISDTEVNSYLRYQAKSQVPVGIVEPTLSALGDGRVSGRAIVDLDVVRKQKERGWLDPMAYLTGTLPLSVNGLLITKDGVGRFQLESAEVSGVPIPKAVLQELLSYYSRSPEHPAGINLDDPFELPARIREIQVGRGESTVVQQ